MEDVWLGNWSSKRRSASEINPRANTFETNRKISELFRDLSNLQQACPLLEGDNWKAYSYRITSGRLMHLDFEISNDGETFDRLRHVSGIGKSTVDKIKEYFERGTFNRIEEFRVDPQRIAMKNMMGIWGVGEKTVSMTNNLSFGGLLPCVTSDNQFSLAGSRPCSGTWVFHHRRYSQGCPKRHDIIGSKSAGRC